MSQYRFKPGTRIKSPVESVVTEIERATVDGRVEMQALVDNAKPKDAPLHREFDWHNATAANKWRLEQARKIVQSVEYVPKDSPPVRNYHSIETVTIEPGEEPKIVRAFRSIDDIMECPESRADILLQAIRDVQSLRKKYGALQELSKVWSALDKAISEIKI